MVRDSVTDDEETTMRLSTPTRADLRRPRNSKGCDDSAHFAGGKERRIARSQAVLAVLFASLSILTPQPARGVDLSELLSEGDLIAGDKRFSSFVLNFGEEDPPPVFDDIFVQPTVTALGEGIEIVGIPSVGPGEVFGFDLSFFVSELDPASLISDIAVAVDGETEGGRRRLDPSEAVFRRNTVVRLRPRVR
jgi:hypothetical protein